MLVCANAKPKISSKVIAKLLTGPRSSIVLVVYTVMKITINHNKSD